MKRTIKTSEIMRQLGGGSYPIDLAKIIIFLDRAAQYLHCELEDIPERDWTEEELRQLGLKIEQE